MYECVSSVCVCELFIISVVRVTRVVNKNSTVTHLLPFPHTISRTLVSRRTQVVVRVPRAIFGVETV